ncbi:NTF2-related export protein, partial [Habropoda laboriosa]
DLKTKIDQACRTAEEFTKLYYESLDKRRYLISRLYLDTATLIWNGNDAQPITGPEVADQLTFLVKVGGQVKYDDKALKPFNQSFLIAALGDKWKIVSDCFRVQDVLENVN